MSTYLGVDLSSRHIRIGTVDEAGNLLSFRRSPHHLLSNDSGRNLAEKLKSVVADYIAENKLSLDGIGVGFPGLVNYSTHRVVRMPNAPSLNEIDLYAEFTSKFNVPVVFENNTNAATVAEMKLGVANGVDDWLFLRIGYGVGAGLVLDGKLRRGKSGFAGEIGHLNIDPEGLDCACGSRGCLETICSAPNIVRRTHSRLDRDKTSSLALFENRDEDFSYDDIIKAALDGDDLANLMMQRTGYFVGMAVADLINILNLSMVVIGGNSAARPLLVPAIANEAKRRSFQDSFDDCKIISGKLASDAGVIGAGLLAHAANVA
jgi:glucokinase